MNDFFIGIELTRHCNLRCAHCFRADLDKVSEIPYETVEKILDQAQTNYSSPHIALTGGETTLHSRFEDVLQLIIDKGFTFHFVTNGFQYKKTFQRLWPIIDHPQWKGVSVSLDGASEETHDAIRGKGSFHRALATIAIALIHQKEVVVQMVVHRGNRHELEEMALLGSKMKFTRLHIAHMQPTPHAVQHGLLCSPQEYRKVENEIRDLMTRFTLPIQLSAGFYDKTPVAHCRFLKLGALNIDHQGRLTNCCQLSNLEGGEGGHDIVADLNEVPLEEAHRKLLETYNDLFADRLQKMQSGKKHDLDNFHCWSCMKHFKKVEWMKDFPENEWVEQDPYFKKENWMNYRVDEKNTLYAELAPEEGVLLNLQTKYYFRLNETSQIIWKGLADGKSMDVIAEEMKETYDVQPDEVLKDIGDLTTKLFDEGFLVSDEAAPKFSVQGAQNSKKHA